MSWILWDRQITCYINKKIYRAPGNIFSNCLMVSSCWEMIAFTTIPDWNHAGELLFSTTGRWRMCLPVMRAMQSSIDWSGVTEITPEVITFRTAIWWEIPLLMLSFLRSPVLKKIPSIDPPIITKSARHFFSAITFRASKTIVSGAIDQISLPLACKHFWRLS